MHRLSLIHISEPTRQPCIAYAVFSGTDEWYEQVARSKPPKDAPWYHVLVDGATHTTYVAERTLEPAARHDPVRHPLLDALFERFEDGSYRLRGQVN